MQIQTNNIREDQIRSTAAKVKNEQVRASAFQFADNRPETAVQRKLQAMANDGPQVKQAIQRQAMMNDYSAQLRKLIQKQENKSNLNKRTEAPLIQNKLVFDSSDLTKGKIDGGFWFAVDLMNSVRFYHENYQVNDKERQAADLQRIIDKCDAFKTNEEEASKKNSWMEENKAARLLTTQTLRLAASTELATIQTDDQSIATGTAPKEQYVIPFDHAPKSAPGEEIILGAVYTHASPENYRLVYTSNGGYFDRTGSGINRKVIPGLNIRNLSWFVGGGWNGETAVDITLQLQTSLGTVLNTKTWNFSKKTYHPTEITQKEAEGERTNPSVYTYKVGPNTTVADRYIGWTILEKFGDHTTSLRPEDLNDDYCKANGLTTSDKIAKHFFPGSGDNGTFTVSKGDEFYDQHAGSAGMAAAKQQLKIPKDIEKTLPQTYESDPGKSIGNYKITRILKTNNSTAIKKEKN
jgi:hypothetical protein